MRAMSAGSPRQQGRWCGCAPASVGSERRMADPMTPRPTISIRFGLDLLCRNDEPIRSWPARSDMMQDRATQNRGVDIVAENVLLASVGLGWWGKVLAKAALDTGEAEVVSCFARGEEGRRDFASNFGCREAASYEELLADDEVDGVIIATSHQTHRRLIEEAAEAGKAVFVEKPLTLTVEEGLSAVEAAEKAGVVLQVGQQRRRSAANRRIKTMIDAGEVGDIEAVQAVQSVPNGFTMPDVAWRWDPDQSPLGGMTSLGVHKIDSMRYLAGPIKSVYCRSRPGRDVTIDEATVLAFEFASGAVGSLLTSFFTPVINELAVFGTEASVFNRADGTRLAVQKRGEPEPAPVDLEPVDPIVDQLAEFVRAVRGEVRPEVDGWTGLEVVAVLEAAVASNGSGRAVEVEAVR